MGKKYGRRCSLRQRKANVSSFNKCVLSAAPDLSRLNHSKTEADFQKLTIANNAGEVNAQISKRFVTKEWSVVSSILKTCSFLFRCFLQEKCIQLKYNKDKNILWGSLINFLKSDIETACTSNCLIADLKLKWVSDKKTLFSVNYHEIRLS